MSSARFIETERPAVLARSRFGPWLLPTGGGISGAISDSASATDGVVAVLAAVAAVSDGATATDVAVATLAAAGALSDTAAATDAAVATLVASQSLTDAATATDSVSAALALSISITDSATATDGITGSVGEPFGAVSDVATASDAVAAALAASMLLVDVATATDSVSAALALSLSIADVATATDSITVSIGGPSGPIPDYPPLDDASWAASDLDVNGVRLPNQAPGDRWNHTFNLGQSPGDSLIGTPIVTADPATVAIEAPAIIANQVVAWISGGVAGTLYRLTITCRTARGRDLRQIASLYVGPVDLNDPTLIGGMRN